MAEDLLTAQEAADFLRVKKSTLYEMVKRGQIPSAKIGKQLRIARADLEAFFRTPAPAEASAAAQTPQPMAKAGTLVLCGQDSCLDIIANSVSALPGAVPVLRSHSGSYNSLYMLYQGKVDIATAHLWDGETDSYNLPYLPKLLPGVQTIAIRLFGRMEGIYVRRGNPKKIKGLEDLRRTDVTMVNREKGSGVRILLDQKLKAMGIDHTAVRGYDREHNNHLSVAGAVARGEADMGVGAETAARQVPDVEFIPVQKEWYDMVFPAYREREATFRLLIEYVTSPAFREELAQFGSYDLSQTGKLFYV